MRIGRRSFFQGWPLFGALPGAAEPAMAPKSLEQRLISVFDGMEIADTHEHLLYEQERVTRQIDFFDLLSHYTMGDAISAGMPAEAQKIVRDKQAADGDRWRAVEPFWEFSRFTGYSRCLRTAVRDIYGFDEISEATIGRINEAIRARNKPGLYRYVLKDRAKIRFFVQDDRAQTPTPADREFFVIAREFDDFIVPQNRASIERLEGLTGTSITNVGSLKQALEKRFDQALKGGMVAVKSLLAYRREILFHEVDQADASRDFENLVLGNRKLPEGFRQRVERPFRNLEDYMFHQVIRLADAHGIPVQIHTGLNNANFTTNSNPVHLTNVFFLYPRTRFDLFHIGYPYVSEMSVLAKSFANVYIDFCWAYIISPTVSRRALDEYLDTVPSNKILAFGGDFIYPELSYAHAKMARRGVAQVLAAKVADGSCGEEDALALGRRLLHDNAAGLFFRSGIRA